jgi:hypothetical protein
MCHVLEHNYTQCITTILPGQVQAFRLTQHWFEYLFSNRYMFRSYDHLQALDGNPEPDLVHATECKQPTLRLQFYRCFI